MILLHNFTFNVGHVKIANARFIFYSVTLSAT